LTQPGDEKLLAPSVILVHLGQAPDHQRVEVASSVGEESGQRRTVVVIEEKDLAASTVKTEQVPTPARVSKGDHVACDAGFHTHLANGAEFVNADETAVTRIL
jgi:hypothetical protein